MSWMPNLALWLGSHILNLFFWIITMVINTIPWPADLTDFVLQVPAVFPQFTGVMCDCGVAEAIAIIWSSYLVKWTIQICIWAMKTAIWMALMTMMQTIVAAATNVLKMIALSI